MSTTPPASPKHKTSVCSISKVIGSRFPAGTVIKFWQPRSSVTLKNTSPVRSSKTPSVPVCSGTSATITPVVLGAVTWANV